MKQSALARLERGNSKPRKSTLKKIAETLEIELEQLID
jgi:transcriptional regulator with XRE-family HTH domain